MFKRSNWAVMGVEREGLDAFKQNLQDPRILLEVSQLSAITWTRLHQEDTVGINSYAAPRFDENLKWPNPDNALISQPDPWVDGPDAALVNMLDAYLSSKPEDKITSGILTDLFEHAASLNEASYHIDDEQFGFWAVFNQWKDVCDLDSKKEAFAYELSNVPYSFLSNDNKKTIDQRVAQQAVVKRTQYPVIINFMTGRIFIQNTNQKELESLQVHLSKLGLKFVGLRWDFGSSDWMTKFITHIEEKTSFSTEFKARADEHTRFDKAMIPKLEDAGMEKIVSTFFATSELPTGQWAALGVPAQIKLHKASQPITVASSPNATTLLAVTDEAFPFAASLTLQELKSKFDKAGVETIWRNDVLKMDLNNEFINLQEVGAALLKGFDSPTTKKDILTRIKKDKATFDISYFWRQWLIALQDGVLVFTDNVVETLELERGEWGIQPYDETVEPEAESV
jgi:hypothetical protein